MKTLLVMRHAKSSWDDPASADRDRPLNRRGREAAEKMGRWMLERNLVPDRILSSDSERTRQTVTLLSSQWPRPIDTQFTAELYLCPAAEIADVVRKYGGDADRLLILGHNPGMEEFLEATVGYAKKFPTAAFAELRVDAASWSHFRVDSPISLESLRRPRELD